MTSRHDEVIDNISITSYNYTVEPPIVDPPRKGQCMLDLFIKDIAEGPKNYSL